MHTIILIYLTVTHRFANRGSPLPVYESFVEVTVSLLYSYHRTNSKDEKGLQNRVTSGYLANQNMG